MRRAATILLLVVALPAPSLAAAAGPAAPSAEEASRRSQAEWLEDVAYFARELPRRHKNLYHTMPREQFEASVRELEAAVASLADHEIVVRLSQIAAKVGDGHTRVHIPASFGRYPLGLYWFGSDLRVIAATPEHEAALGSRVVGIGGKSLDEVQARAGTCFPSAENENPWYVLSTSPAYILRPEVLHALGIVADVQRAPFTLEDDQGRRSILEVPRVEQDGTLTGRFRWSAAAEPLSRQRRGERFWFTRLPGSKTVYVSWRGYESLGGHARELFKSLDESPPDRLVIDLRQNGGGDFLEGRKRILDPIRKRPALNRKGALYVLVGRQTFSAAMVNAIDFRKQTHAILVGEPIGERPNSYSENDEMTLPNSRIVVSYSTRYYQFLDQDAPAVMPDQRIDPSWDDYKAGRDPVMDWVLAAPAPLAAPTAPAGPGD
ncbi:MAG TPA: hypothetical protein VJV23_04945 [Candidatus Polarisedimenticolia bacterium]|nr:hypothetical protein [Candidatus Polarisedimenticolia bacterium]